MRRRRRRHDRHADKGEHGHAPPNGAVGGVAVHERVAGQRHVPVGLRGGGLELGHLLEQLLVQVTAARLGQEHHQLAGQRRIEQRHVRALKVPRAQAARHHLPVVALATRWNMRLEQRPSPTQPRTRCIIATLQVGHVLATLILRACRCRVATVA